MEQSTLELQSVFPDETTLQKAADDFGEFWAGNNGSYDDLGDEEQNEEFEEEKSKYSLGYYYGYKAALGDIAAQQKGETKI